jgi:coatomer subunit beta
MAMMSSSSSIEKNCTLLINYDKGGTFTVASVKEKMQDSDEEVKIAALKETILYMLNGENCSALTMDVIRFCMPSEENFQLKKLCYLFLESVDKTDSKGVMLPEMILVCNFVQQDLVHSNEYMRGVALRFVQKLKYAQLIEPLVPSILQNLEARHAFVRRNAACTMFAVFTDFPELLVDAPEVMSKFLSTEDDMSAKRNALLMLFRSNEELAVQWLSDNLERVSQLADILQMVVLEIIRKSCRTFPQLKGRFLRTLIELLQGASPGVAYEAAGTLLSLSSAGSAVKAATACYCQLLVQQSDNNVKLIILDRLDEVKRRHPSVLQGLVMDMLQALASPNMDIRRKCLDVALSLVTKKNIDEVVQILKKEVLKTQGREMEKGGEYRQMLVRGIHQCAVKFPDVANNVVHLLMDFLGDTTGSSAVDVIFFVREIVDTYPDLRTSILQKLNMMFPMIRSSRVARSALWILAQYSSEGASASAAFQTICQAVGPLPFVAVKQEDTTEQTDTTKPAETATKVVVMADGTYATQSVEQATQELQAKEMDLSLRSMLLGGDFYLGAVISTSLTKLAIRLEELGAAGNAKAAQAMLIMCGIVRLGHSSVVPQPLDADTEERLALCLRVLAEPDPTVRNVYLNKCKDSFSFKLSVAEKPTTKEESDMGNRREPDDLINIRLLTPATSLPGDEDTSDAAAWLKAKAGSEEFSSRLQRITQLTGFSDPVYAEAVVTVHEYDIILDVMVINQTDETLQNLSLELSTVGDLRLCERPQATNLSAHSTHHVKANIKVSSTETGIIFGSIVWDDKADQGNVILNDIHIDIMDYISPATCSELSFRSMWAEFEWENKVAINTTLEDEHEYLEHICNSTNMHCLTPPNAREGSCGFLAANLYAKSLFGEDALVNISIEKQQDGKIGGYVRIRSKTQGIALSLGDKITLKQKV